MATAIFDGIYIGDIVVSLKEIDPYRKENDMFVVRSDSERMRLFYKKGTCSTDPKTFRKATDKEVAWYKRAETNRNINNMPKEEIINSYSIF